MKINRKEVINTRTCEILAGVSKDILKSMKENPDRVYFPNLGERDNIFKQGISIDRVFFTVPGINLKIYWYGFLISVGLILAVFYGFKKMRTVGINPDKAVDAVLAGFIGAIIGARAYYIAFDESLSFKNFFEYRDGGLAIYGGIIGALLFGGIAAKIRKINIPALFDVASPCFLIGQAIGRWGNFFNQEAFGANTDLPWGMISYKTSSYISENYDNLGKSVSPNLPVHPCFLYESVWCLICFFILRYYLKHRKFDGEVFLAYAGLYGFGRFFIESTRTDSLYIFNIKVSQLIAAVCVIASISLITVFRIKIKKKADYKLYCETEMSKKEISEYDSNKKKSKKSDDTKSETDKNNDQEVKENE